MFYTIHLGRAKKVLLFVTVVLCLVLGFVIVVRTLYPLNYVGYIREHAAKYGLDPALVCAVIRTESKFEKNAKSHKDASGLMQITKPTGDWLAEEMKMEGFDYEQIFEPELNISIGCYYLNKLLKKYDGNYQTALAAYNAGGGNVDKWLKNEKYSLDGENLAVIPFNETKNYVRRVTFNLEIYKILLKIYGGTDD